jgi:hypothetical protein
MMIVQMENLPFLSKGQEPQLRNDRPQSESEWPQQQTRFEPVYAEPHKPDVLESLKANPMGLILLGLIIGILLANMRPVVIQPK